MKSPNLGWVYYHYLYNKPFAFDYLKIFGKNKDSNNDAVLKEKTEKLLKSELGDFSSNDLDRTSNSNEIQTFELTTTYPGLLCGSGYNHGISSEADYKIGFYFDHTSGIPVIPGSSVKGVLRSVFPKDSTDKRNYDFIRELMTTANESLENKDKITRSFSNEDIDKLKVLIFDGLWDGVPKSYYKRDVFFDAYPIKAFDEYNLFLANDYITPHFNKENPKYSILMNPTPLQFLKIRSNVKFQFQFKLTDEGVLKGIQKKELFKEIIKYIGVGAKTNVGYGQLVEKHDEGTEKNLEEPNDPTKRKIVVNKKKTG